ncbi:hypothetical protein [Amycolatopsis jejuensis]|nr:hypothetical protein [Amycolatopsis jejuensis]
MTADQSTATPIFDGVVAESGVVWTEEDVPKKPSADDQRRGQGK